MFNDAKQIIFMTYMQFVIKESVFTIKLKKNQTFHAFSDAKPDIIYKKNWGNIFFKKKEATPLACIFTLNRGCFGIRAFNWNKQCLERLVGGKLKSTLPGQ